MIYYKTITLFRGEKLYDAIFTGLGSELLVVLGISIAIGILGFYISKGRLGTQNAIHLGYSFTIAALCFFLINFGFSLINPNIILSINQTGTPIIDRAFDYGALFLGFGFAGLIFAIGHIINISSKNSTNERINSIYTGVKEIQEQIKDPVSNPDVKTQNQEINFIDENSSQNVNVNKAYKYTVNIMGLGILFWIFDALFNKNILSMFEWGFPLFICGVSIYLVILQFEKQQTDSNEMMLRISAIEQKLDDEKIVSKIDLNTQLIVQRLEQKEESLKDSASASEPLEPHEGDDNSDQSTKKEK